MKETVFSLTLEPELRDAFMVAADASHRPASEIVRDMMRAFVADHHDAQSYDAFLGRKVDAARASVEADRGRADSVVETEFAARRAARAPAGEA